MQCPKQNQTVECFHKLRWKQSTITWRTSTTNNSSCWRREKFQSVSLFLFTLRLHSNLMLSNFRYVAPYLPNLGSLNLAFQLQQRYWRNPSHAPKIEWLHLCNRLSFIRTVEFSNRQLRFLQLIMLEPEVQYSYRPPPLLGFFSEWTLISSLGGPECLLIPAGEDENESCFLAEPADPFSGVPFPNGLGIR